MSPMLSPLENMVLGATIDSACLTPGADPVAAVRDRPLFRYPPVYRFPCLLHLSCRGKCILFCFNAAGASCLTRVSDASCLSTRHIRLFFVKTLCPVLRPRVDSHVGGVLTVACSEAVVSADRGGVIVSSQPTITNRSQVSFPSA